MMLMALLRSAAGQVVRAPTEARFCVDSFLPDHRNKKAEKTSDPALQRVVEGRHLPGDDDAENREPEIFVRAKAQRKLGKERGDRGEEDHTDEGADHGSTRR
jgi:hypothetical protein